MKFAKDLAAEEIRHFEDLIKQINKLKTVKVGYTDV